MLKLMVTTCNGQPLGSPVAAEFTEQGGNIGRSSGNTLVLPDAQRYISRTHALVFFRAGLYLIKCVGTSSPVFVNDWQLGTGQEAPIGHGDEIRIAGYSVRVIVDKMHEAPAPSLPVDVPVVAASGSVKDDPLAAFGGGVSHGDPFARSDSSTPTIARARILRAEPTGCAGCAGGPSARSDSTGRDCKAGSNQLAAKVSYDQLGAKRDSGGFRSVRRFDSGGPTAACAAAR